MPERSGAAAFGAVGALIGAAGALVVLLLGTAAPLAAGAAAVGTIALATGALHLDGVGDTFDALAAPDPGAAEAARRDPRLGAAGVVAIVTLLIADAALIGQLVTTSGPLAAGVACIVAAASSRALAVATGWLHRGGVREGGAAWFAQRLTRASVGASGASAAIVAIAAAVVVGSGSILVGTALGVVGALAASAALVRARGGLDGDGLGAGVELAFAAVLLGWVLAA